MNIEDAVRLFGSSGLLVQDELRLVEKQLGYKVRNEAATREQNSGHDTEYYPQFDAKVREEAASMSRHYEVFYCLERSIRRLVQSRMAEAKGVNWWETAAPQSVRDEVRKNQTREIDSAITIRSDDPLDYTTFGQLGEIIIANYDVFADTFTGQRAVTRVMAQLNTLRGPIAHCCPLSEDEVLRLKLGVKDWFRLME